MEPCCAPWQRIGKHFDSPPSTDVSSELIPDVSPLFTLWWSWSLSREVQSCARKCSSYLLSWQSDYQCAPSEASSKPPERLFQQSIIFSLGSRSASNPTR